VVERLHVKQELHPFKTFKFSSGVLPIGTISAGRLGNEYNLSVSSVAIASEISANFFFSLFKTVFLLR
jgi:hypothetical protein